MFNYIQAHVEDRRTSSPVDKGNANIFQTRFQINF
jgi:hypothetical protein